MLREDLGSMLNSTRTHPTNESSWCDFNPPKTDECVFNYLWWIMVVAKIPRGRHKLNLDLNRHEFNINRSLPDEKRKKMHLDTISLIGGIVRWGLGKTFEFYDGKVCSLSLKSLIMQILISVNGCRIKIRYLRGEKRKEKVWGLLKEVIFQLQLMLNDFHWRCKNSTTSYDLRCKVKSMDRKRF